MRKRQRRSLATSLLLAIVITCPILADEYIVDDFGDIADSMPGDGSCATDSGGCTLRAAVEEANAAFGPDSISFAGGDDVILNATLLGTIPITDALAIQGSGNRITALGLAVSMLDVSGVNSVVDLRDLTFTNSTGQALSIDDGANVLVLGCIFKGNNSGFAGAGIMVEGGTVLIRASEIRENTAASGPAIWAATVAAVVTVENTVIRDNTSLAGAGGAIQSIGAILEITNTQLLGNTAATNGGAIAASGRLTIGPDVVIDDNEATVGDGGGVHYMDLGASSTLSLGVSAISNNKASGNGGGLYYWSTVGTFEATRTALVLNEAGASGGGLYYVHTLGGTPQTFVDGRIAGNKADDGGGVFLTPGSLEISRSTISDNQAIRMGGGVHHSGGGFHSIVNSTISTNTATAGGGIYGATSAANLALFNVTVYNNTGGGVHTVGGAPIVTLSNSVVAQGPAGSGTDCDTGVNSVNPNLDSDGTCGASLSSDPLFGPLILVTGAGIHIPASGSAVVGGGNNAVCLAPPVGGVDQKGFLRPFAANCDLGAVESGVLAFVDGFEDGSSSFWSSTTP